MLPIPVTDKQGARMLMGYSTPIWFIIITKGENVDLQQVIRSKSKAKNTCLRGSSRQWDMATIIIKSWSAINFLHSLYSGKAHFCQKSKMNLGNNYSQRSILVYLKNNSGNICCSVNL